MHKLKKNKAMKRLIIWLAKIFNVNLTVEKIIFKDKIVERIVEKQIALGEHIRGDVFVEGNLTIDGELRVSGEIACYNSKK